MKHQSHPAILLDAVADLRWVKVFGFNGHAERLEQMVADRCDPRAVPGEHGFYEYVDRKWRFRRNDTQPAKSIEAQTR